MEAPTTAGTIMVSHIIELFTQPSVAGVLTTTSAHITDTISEASVDASVGALTTTFHQKTEIPDAFDGALTTTFLQKTEIPDAFVGVLTTTSAHITDTISEASVGVLTTSAHMIETISDASVGVLTTTSAHITETISDASVGVLTTTSAHMTETTSDAFLVGAAIVKPVSFEVLFVGVIIVVVLVVVLVLVLCYNGKHKGTYHTNEAECGDSDSVDTYGVASQSELEILNEEE
ncbi:cell adhesion molecule 2 isoform X2 [Oncorhynchus kisutch]|uniref:cell adhesion molecule 2 isoform X2 n=1 Tax=Oncorhynchus kisutch TaxID=8019 RepID=UPI0012DBE3BB|nr:cell adhesion molecule 2 isoform X2 [Oncorhynchus kisutch]